MTIQTTIEQKLEQAFNSDYLAVENESHKHNVPANSETHFKVTLVSGQFEGQGKVKRHQAIYKLLGDELAGGVHALALHLYTPEEWTKTGEASPDSPNCLGGSKHDPAFAAGMRHVKGAVKDDIGDRVKSAVRQVLGARDEIAGRIVHQCIERAVGPDRLDHLLDRHRIANVERHQTVVSGS